MLTLRLSDEIFEDSFLKNGKLEFGSEAFIPSIKIYSLNDNKVHNQNIFFSKILIKNISENLRKLSLILFSKFKVMFKKWNGIKNALKSPKSGFASKLTQRAAPRLSYYDKAGDRVENVTLDVFIRSEKFYQALRSEVKSAESCRMVKKFLKLEFFGTIVQNTLAPLNFENLRD